ncbi:MAG: hypothetical protein RL692_926 [Planctomycetota bacterium]|jgi:hypothetical protein
MIQQSIDQQAIIQDANSVISDLEIEIKLTARAYL